MNLRETSAIGAYLGLNGSGKTWFAVRDAVSRKRPILSTVRIDSPLFVPLTSMRDLTEFEHGTVLLDEVQSLLSSRDFSTLPPEVLTMLLQLRKRDLTLLWTTPTWQRADTVLREITRTTTVCNGSWFVRSEGAWPRPRRLTARTYESQKYEDFQNGLLKDSKGFPAKKIRPIVKQTCAPAKEDVRYRSDEQILQIAAVVKGTCITCGGRRSQPSCRCSGL